LGHEPLDYAVENDAVVELLAGKLFDVRDMSWGETGRMSMTTCPCVVSSVSVLPTPA
jgi:hypothetical protein